MNRSMILLLLALTCPALTGCIPMMAVSAAGMAVQGAEGSRASNQVLQPQAREQCVAQAARYGTVHVIDVEQHRIDQIIVWGTVADAKQTRSFQCDFGTKITGFTLRRIRPAP